MSKFFLLFALVIAISAHAQKSFEASPSRSPSSASTFARLTLEQAWCLAEQANSRLRSAEVARQGLALRLRPAFITASVAILDLIPMFRPQERRTEKQRPLATIIVGGLLISAALTLLVRLLICEWIEVRAGRRRMNE